MLTLKFDRSVWSRCISVASACLSLTAISAHASHQMPSAEMDKKVASSVGAGFAPNGDLWLVQQDEQARLTLQISQDEGKNWQAPRVLDTGHDRIKSTSENPPKLLFGPGGVVLISYAQPLEKKFSGNIRLLRSGDGGKSFSAPVTLHQDRQTISHSYVAMAFDAQGILHTVWIDGRDKLAASDPRSKTNANYRGVTLYRNQSRDGGISFGPDIKFSDHSCECCRLALTPTPHGRLALMWRQVSEPNIRDHAFAILPAATNASKPTEPSEAVKPTRASYDNWAIDGCPHHGPALSPAADGGYHAVWFGQRAGVASVRYGRLDPQGKPDGTVVELPDPRAEHADILRSGGKLAIVWRSYDGTTMNLKAWISEDEGRSFTLKQLAHTEDESDYPRLLAKNGKIFVIWNTTGKMYVEAL